MSALVATLSLMLLVVAALGVLNTVVQDTRERIHDLGIFKALGMTPRQTVTMVLTSVALTGLVAGLIGVPIGAAVERATMTPMGNAVGMHLPPSVTNTYSPGLVLPLLAGGIVIALLGALLPAGWAAQSRTAERAADRVGRRSQPAGAVSEAPKRRVMAVTWAVAAQSRRNAGRPGLIPSKGRHSAVALQSIQTSTQWRERHSTMAVSVFDLFSIGIGPSSSHTVGPMRAARMFVKRLDNEDVLPKVARIRAELFGSLGATGHGHGTPKAVLLGLEGQVPATVDVRGAETDLARIRRADGCGCWGPSTARAAEIAFSEDRDLVLHRRKSLPYHSNGMQLSAYDEHGEPLLAKTYYSVGGGFVVDEDAVGADRVVLDDTVLKYPFRTGAELLDLTAPDRRSAQRPDAGERTRLAHRGRDPRRAAGDLAGDARVRRRTASPARASCPAA